MKAWLVLFLICMVAIPATVAVLAGLLWVLMLIGGTVGWWLVTLIIISAFFATLMWVED